jgi:predicted ester cyclase
MTTDDAAARTAVRNFYEALYTGELSLLDSALATDWAAIPALRTGAGPDGWKASIAHLRTVFSDLTGTIEDLLVDGDRVAARTVSRGTHTGELLGVAGTGRPVEFRASDVHRIEAGRIVQTWHLEDYFGIASQLGLTFVPAE